MVGSIHHIVGPSGCGAPEFPYRFYDLPPMHQENIRGTPWGTFALQDVVVLGYMMTVVVLLWVRSPPPGPGPVIYAIYAAMGLVSVAAFVVRRVPQIPYRVTSNAYRVILVGAIFWGYLMLRDVLPVIRPDTMDASLAAIDQRMFGVQPVLWMERLNQRPIVEWMSFFYFNHYTLILAHVIGAVWIARSPRVAAEFSLGTALLFCIGHLGYMAVPAYGPVVFFKDRFQTPVDGATFWGLVSSSVAAGGAMKDVFPSLHTGGSTWLAFFAVHQARHDRRWRIPALLTCFFALNIVVSTLVLRWHYAIDVLAGLVLSSSVAYTTARLAPWETVWRQRRGLPPVWPEPQPHTQAALNP